MAMRGETRQGRVACHTARLLMLVVVAGVAAAAAAEEEPALGAPTVSDTTVGAPSEVDYLSSHRCKCNYGVVDQSKPHCVCACFHGYLQPACLYRATDRVKQEFWIDTAQLTGDGTVPVSPTLVFDRAVFTQQLNAALGMLGDDPEAVSFVYASVPANVTANTDLFTLSPGKAPTEEPENTPKPVSIAARRQQKLQVVMQVPGWGAQQLLADDLHSEPWLRTLGVEAVLNHAEAPTPPRRYAGEWLFIYPIAMRYMYVSFVEVSWLLLAILVVMTLLVIERRYMFNYQFNITNLVPRYMLPETEVTSMKSQGKLKGKGGSMRA